LIGHSSYELTILKLINFNIPKTAAIHVIAYSNGCP